MKTYILGDIHGEYSRCCEILQHVGIFDENGHWKKGCKCRLIQTGDIVDRGSEVIESVELFERLQCEAPNEGGVVIRLLGNHELGHIGGPIIARARDTELLVDRIKSAVVSGRIVAAYLLDGWMVVHAGIMPHIFGNNDLKKRSLRELADELNFKLLNAVITGDFSDDIFFIGQSRGGTGKPGIFWADYNIDLLEREDELIHQIVGHTPSRCKIPEIKRSPKGKIFDIDVGICTMYGGNKGLLLYEDGVFTPVLF